MLFLKVVMSKKVFFVLLVVLVAFGCAKRGFITGGEEDILPPEVMRTSPQNFSTHFNSNEITIQFDEYVKLKDVSKQLIISPPFKHRPEITPMSASKEIKLRIRDTLEPNTTYSLNFGQSIEDNNEGNVLLGYRYVFSTGSYIDSLSISGRVKDALDKDTESFVSVLLYEINEQFNDSIIYKENPRYITNTLDSVAFTLENLKEGEYLLVALKDKNNNNRFDPKQDKIAYNSEIISVPSDENFSLNLFKQIPDYKPVRAFENSKNRITFAYEGKQDSLIDIKLKNENHLLETLITKVSEKDSLNVWYKPVEADSLMLETSKNNIEKQFTVKLRSEEIDTLRFEMKTSKQLSFRDNIRYTTSTPLVAFDKSRIELLDKDSINVDFDTKYDKWNQNFEILFEKEENQKYYLNILPDAVTDFFEGTNDTIKETLTTRNYSDFGNLRVALQNIEEFPVIVQLTDDKGVVLAEVYSEEESTVEFLYLNPAIYNLRAIYDSNKNKIWDTGNFLQKIQPEKVIYYPEKIDVRANWDIEQIFNLRE